MGNNKLPFMQLYVDAWAADMDEHPIEIEGAWIRICIKLHRSPTRGRAAKSLRNWARILRLSEDEALRVISYLKSEAIGSISGLSQNGHNQIVIACRRMLREEKVREDARLRKRLERSRRQDTPPKNHHVTKSHKNVTGDIIYSRDKNNIPPPISPPKNPITQMKIISRVDAWNDAMGQRLRWQTYSKMFESRIKEDPEFFDKFDKALLMVPNIKARDWKKSLTWFLRPGKGEPPTIDRILDGCYPMIADPDEEPTDKEKARDEADRKLIEDLRQKGEIS